MHKFTLISSIAITLFFCGCNQGKNNKEENQDSTYIDGDTTIQDEDSTGLDDIQNNDSISNNKQTAIDGKPDSSRTIADEYYAPYNGWDTITEKTNRVIDPSKKIIYLTFDDGPSPNTLKILNILREKNVHGTFFVTAHDKNSFKYIKQAYEEGNAIAAHSYTHNYNIYTSFETYFDDLEKIEQVIEQYTGKRTSMIRFPGGSSNTVFKKHNPDPYFMNKLSREVQLRGYQYVDWNLSSNDATSGCPPLATIINSSCKANKQEICLLMHDTNAKNTTVAALPTIIDYFKSRGYSFEVLSDPAYICHHNIRPRAKKTTPKVQEPKSTDTHKTTVDTTASLVAKSTNSAKQAKRSSHHRRRHSKRYV